MKSVGGSRMQDKLYELKALLEAYKDGERKLSCVEIGLIMINLFLLGMLIGMLVSPRKTVTIASNNGDCMIAEAEEEDEE